MNRLKPLERVRYWQGQLLTAADLRAQVASDLESRRLHNRSVHQAYGVMSGFAVTFDAGGVSVACGLAYDCSGRPLVSLRTRTVPFPPLYKQYVTLIAFYDRESPDEIGLDWKGRYDLQPGVGVPLTRAVPKGGAWTPDESFLAVAARPLSRPRLATGQTVPGDTPWKGWTDPDTGKSLGVETIVDTSSAGFTMSPRYFASAVRDVPSVRFADAWFPNLADTSPQGFTLRLFLAGIERERLAPITVFDFATNNPGLNATVQVTNGDAFVQFDTVSRLTPRLRDYVVVDKASKKTITTATPLTGTPAQLAAGSGARTAVVHTPSTPGAGFAVQVADATKFRPLDVVVRMGANPEEAPVRIVTSKEPDDTLILSNPIPGLDGRDLGRALKQGTVLTVTGTAPMVITVDHPEKFHEQDIVVRMTDPEKATPSKITHIDPITLAITLSAPIQDLATIKGPLGVAGDATAVVDVFDETGDADVTVEAVGALREGDLVVRRDTTLSDPVLIRHINKSAKKLTLSSAIPSLVKTDVLLAAMFRIRQTVQAVGMSAGKQTVSVSSPSSFPKLAFVARIDEGFNASVPSSVFDNSGSDLVLNTPIPGLQAGDVIALAEFPPTANVSGFDPASLRVTVDSTRGFKAGDAVVSDKRSQASSVANVESATSLVLADPIADLRGADLLSVIAMSLVLNVTSPPAGNDVKVEDASAIRTGDLIGPLAGWVGTTAPQLINRAVSGSIELSGFLDGVLSGDSIGSASIVPGFSILRLKSVPPLVSGRDTVTISGRDTLSGRTITISGSVGDLVDPFILLVFSSANPFSLRLEEITASVPFSGNPDEFAAAARKEGLYVEWFGCEEQTRRPFDCEGPAPDPTGCGCVQEARYLRSDQHG